MKHFILSILIIISLQAKDKIYLLPKDGKQAEKNLVNLISHSHQKIKIAMFTFTNKKIYKALKNAARRGIDIQIIADKRNNSDQRHYSIVPQLQKLRNIKIHLLSGLKARGYRGIMHIKMMIIDDGVVAFGSANYTKSAFYKNYEILYINDDWTFTRRFVKIFKELWKIR